MLGWVLAGGLAVVGVGCGMSSGSDPAGDAGAPRRDAEGGRDAGDAGVGPGSDAGTPEDGGTVRDGGTVAQPDGGVGTDAGSGEPIAADGDWAIEGSWDVSSPIGGDRTLGVVATELFIEEAVAMSPVPSELEGEAADALEEMIGAELEAWVDARTPPALREGSPLMVALGALAAEIDYESELTLAIEPGSGAIDGTETFTRISVDHAGRTFELPLDMLTVGGEPGATLEAPWTGEANASTTLLDVDQHVIQIRFGVLVLWLVEAVLRVDAGALQAQAIEALACSAIVDEVTGGTGSIEIDLGLTSVEISRSTLMSACAEVVGQVEERALGLFEMDTPMEVGGTVELEDTDADGGADAMRSGADHGGHVLVGPRAISPRVTATFTGTRGGA